MEHNKLSTEEMVMLARDMTANPEKYGITRDKIHRWALDHVNEASDIIGRIPESLRDGLADATIKAYNE